MRGGTHFRNTHTTHKQSSLAKRQETAVSWLEGISVRIIAREGDEVAERVKRHRSDEEEVEVYLSVLLEKWRKPQVNGAG